MAKEKKFGTFAGVFTPSILTILGVIMYMRLGWVVGQTGIVGTLGIILVAHIISITTGLSISSIATDKKIKAGGIYYILSRSLGLPMGGAIGIALFIGTALSISLYIIGFVENFLSIDAIAQFLNLTPGVEAYRIVGSVVIVILVILAFISTSLAIKSQFFILGAIVLSLISIFVGFAINTEFIPSVPLYFGAENAESMETVFAIFFPAVTGFTAGVAMSGDLRDPKRNIPRGTMLAISVGFVIYIVLAVGFGVFVNRETLINDNNSSMHVAWIPALVVAGIWGATLSSALGGILGGPRILQALSKDKVTPKIFAKGYGETNEPRNALILIFVIAEAGIMIGNLNVIAGVVTMFYLTSYGFINLAYVLENWASTDFRPSFKISRIFGIIGFIFAFAIMFKLDFISMLVAFVLIGLVYFILQRKQLKLDYGDVWQSVWISIVRKGLHVLDNNSIEDRNWQPNIILFSGATEKRAHLLEFGSSLVGKFGFLSNFDLTVDKNADVLFPKHKQSIPNKKQPEEAIFTRQQSCKDIYDGIEMIVRTYGFSGIEPNTIILGWGRQSKNPERFVKLIQTINELDYNILLVDYDKRYGYGDYKLIDIWWRGAGNNGNFAVTLAKFMVASEKWENAKIRLMIVNNENSKAFYIYRQAIEILRVMRIEAEVKIINNEIEKTPFYDIIRVESKEADIVFLGIPYIKKGQENEFVEKTSALLYNIGTVVLIKASSLFKELNLGVNLNQQSVISASENLNLVEEIANSLIDHKHVELNAQTRRNFEKIVKIYDQTIATFTFKEIDIFLKFLENFNAFANDIFQVILTNLVNLEKQQRINYIEKYQKAIIKKVNKQITDFKTSNIPEMKEMMLDVLFDYGQEIKKYFDSISNDVALNFDVSEFKINKTDSLNYRTFKIRNRKNEKNGVVTIKYSAKDRISNFEPNLVLVLSREIEQIRIETLKFIYSFEVVVKNLVVSLNTLKFAVLEDTTPENQIRKAQKTYSDSYNNLVEATKKIVLNVAKNRKKVVVGILNEFLRKSNTLDEFYKGLKAKNKDKKQAEILIDVKKDILFSSFDLFLNNIMLKNIITTFDTIIVDKINLLSTFALNRFDDLLADIEDDSKKEAAIIQFIEQVQNQTENTIGAIKQIPSELPKSIEIMNQNSLNESLYKGFDTIETINVTLNTILPNLFAEIVISPLTEYVNTFKSDVFGLLEVAKNGKSIEVDKQIKVCVDLFVNNLSNLKNDVLLIKIHKIIDTGR